MDEDPKGTSYNIVPTLTAAQAQELGYLVAWWAFLEHQVAVMGKDLLAISEEEGRAVFTQMNIRPRLQTISLLLPSRAIYDRDVKRFAEFRTAIEEVQAKRNLVAHGLWSEDHDGGRFVLQMWGGKDGVKRLEPEAHPMDDEKISQICGEIAMLAAEFTNWWGEASQRLMPSTYRPW
ncbi:hypothetical protein ACFQRC_07385 [Enterovirga sp. GCM10030262]|uniref:hypothetical protein n=1 Tax=Enterovirga sp. GCM10030262 TaxID=3273391 RepID=UPI003616B0F0